MIPTYVVKEIYDSVKMGYDTLVDGMIGRKRKGVMLINDKYEVRGTYDIGLKDAIQNIIDKIKSGTFKVDAVDSKMADGGMMARGGATFNDKVKSISKRLDKTKVPLKYRKEYGKYFDKEEATQSAQRIVGAITKKEK
jgi:hypothetical protein